MSKVSIVLAVFNGSKFIRSSIESILNQTYTNWELIVINDGSFDDTENILREFEKFDSRISIYSLPENRGLTYCLNMGIAKSKGDYIARMDGDDLMHVDRLKMQVEFLEGNVDYGVVSTAIELIDDMGHRIGIMTPPIEDREIKAKMVFQNPIAHPTVMLRKKVLENLTSIYRVDYPNCEDYDLWIRMSIFTNFYCLDAPLLKYRIHPQQITSKKVRTVNLDVLRLKINSFKDGLLPWYALIGMIKNFAIVILPPKLYRMIQKNRFHK